VDMNGDILKYYKYQHIPLMDLIFSYNHGREGFKLISSSANLYDKPVVAAEIYGAIGIFGGDKFNAKTLYRAAMDVFARGVNFLVPHGMWYNPDSNAVRIPPLISAYSPTIGPELKQYNEWAGRSCMMLQGGQTVSDIAILYPIASLQSWFHFDAKRIKGISDWGKYVAPETDYLAISDMLTNEVHRDFTFVHPEILTSVQVIINNSNLILKNKVNSQNYKVLIVPGGKVISSKAIEKIKAYYNQGGRIIFTSMLPSQSAEFGEDEKVVRVMKEMLQVDPRGNMPDTVLHITKPNGGSVVFLPKPSAALLTETMEKMELGADLSFKDNPQPKSSNGTLSYIHKVKGGKDIYFIENSTDDIIDTYITVRGNITPVLWNPYNGTTKPVAGVQHIEVKGKGHFTKFPFHLDGISSTFVVSQ
jgi:hypothetical protein